MTSIKELGRPSRKAALAVGGLVVVVGLSVAGHALAQQHPGGAGAPHMGPHGGPGPHTAEMCTVMEAHQAGMLAFTEVRLGITDTERPAWIQFVTAVKTASQPLKQLCLSTIGQPEPKTLPDRLHRIEAMETARLEQLRQITPAIETLYGALDPKQKDVADHLIEGMMHHGPGPGPGPGFGPHGPGPGPGFPGGFMHHPPMPGGDGAPADGKQPS